MNRAANVFADAALLDEAKEYGINLSQTFREALEEKVREERARRWLEENREAIEAYNRHIERDGIWSEKYRSW